MQVLIKNSKLCFVKDGLEKTCVDLVKHGKDLKFMLYHMNQIPRFYVKNKKYFPQYFEILPDGRMVYVYKYQEVTIPENIIEKLKEYYNDNIDGDEPFHVVLFFNWYLIPLFLYLIYKNFY